MKEETTEKRKVVIISSPLKITLDECGQFNTSFLETFDKKWLGGY